MSTMMITLFGVAVEIQNNTHFSPFVIPVYLKARCHLQIQKIIDDEDDHDFAEMQTKSKLYYRKPTWVSFKLDKGIELKV